MEKSLSSTIPTAIEKTNLKTGQKEYLSLEFLTPATLPPSMSRISLKFLAAKILVEKNSIVTLLMKNIPHELKEYLILLAPSGNTKSINAKSVLYKAINNNSWTPGLYYDLKNLDGSFISDLNTLLNVAATAQHYELMQFLIKEGAKPHRFLNAQKTPSTTLIEFIQNLSFPFLPEQEEIVKLLITNGAHVNSEDNFEFSPLYWALQKNNVPIIQLLQNRGAILNLNELALYQRLKGPRNLHTFMNVKPSSQNNILP